jgi:hypothetical protein
MAERTESGVSWNAVGKKQRFKGILRRRAVRGGDARRIIIFRRLFEISGGRLVQRNLLAKILI